MTVENPRIFLAVLAAVFSTATAAALCELPCIFLPFTALIVCTLPYASSIVVFAAEVPHNDTSPMLHIWRMMAYCELLNEGEDIEIIREQILFLLVLINGSNLASGLLVKYMQVLSNLEFGYEMGLLEVCPEVTVFGYVSKKL